MKILSGISLVLVILLVSLSAFLRLSHSGIGCPDWPECYGRIGDPPASQVSASGKLKASGEAAYRQLLEASSEPLAWATPLHRLVASVLGLLVVWMNVLALRSKRQRLLCMSLLALTVGLAVLGIRSGNLHDPAVVMGNLSGGFLMLGLLGWLWFTQDRHPEPRDRRGLIYALALTGVILLACQILLGGFTSANFAALSCRTLPDCYGGWWPGSELAPALDLTRKHEVTSEGQAVGGPERVAVHKAHRLGAVVAAFVILLVAALAVGSGGVRRRTGWVILALLLLEFTVGVASVLSGLPIVLAVAHNWLAALLLLSLLKLLTLDRGFARV